MLKESILAAATTLTPWYGDVETEQERRERLETIAVAIAEAVEVATCSKTEKSEGKGRAKPAADGKRREAKAARNKSEKDEPAECRRLWQGDPRVLAFMLLGQAYFETRLALHVHEGRCRTKLGECDTGRAISLWQLQAGHHLPKEKWKTLSGTDLASTRLAALEAAKIVSRSHNFCGSMSGAISLYATGKSCHWAPSQQRARFIRRLIEMH